MHDVGELVVTSISTVSCRNRHGGIRYLLVQVDEDSVLNENLRSVEVDCLRGTFYLKLTFEEAISVACILELDDDVFVFTNLIFVLRVYATCARSFEVRLACSTDNFNAKAPHESIRIVVSASLDDLNLV